MKILCKSNAAPYLSRSRRLMLLAAAALLTILSALAAGCTAYVRLPMDLTGYKLNTYVTVRAYTTGGHSVDEVNTILNDALALCDFYDAMLSRTNKESILYQVNNRETTQIPAELAELIALGLSYSAASNGAFDISIGRVSSLWDFTSEQPQIPDALLLSQALETVDYTRIVLSDRGDGTYDIVLPEGMMLDLGAIAKGYIADKIRTHLLDNGIDRAIINLGGNVLCVGEKSSNTKFNVSIKKPFSNTGESVATLALKDKSAVSSGTYERYFYQNGVLYHHILNPATGYPYDNRLAGVTIICDRSVIGDCLSTACFALGLDAGMELIENTPDAEALFVAESGETYYSSGFSAYLK